MNLDITRVTDPFEVQRIAKETSDVEIIKSLVLKIVRGEIEGGAETCETLKYFLKGRIKHLTGK